jgi:hypothetical protein
MSRDPVDQADAECRQQWRAHVDHVLNARAGIQPQEQLAL